MNQEASAPFASIAIAEKRQATRRPLFCKVRLISNGQMIEGRTLDISVDGIAMMLDVNPAIGYHYSLQLPLPGADGLPHHLQLRVQVLHTVLAKDSFRVGLKFVAPDTQAKTLIKNFVSS